MRRTFSHLVLALLLPMLFSGCWIYVNDPVYHSNTLTIENSIDSFNDIHYIYVTPSDALYWGDDQLGSEVLYPGDQLQMEIYDCNQNFDIWVIYGDFYDDYLYDEYLECDTATTVIFTH